MSDKQSNKLLDASQLKGALKESFIKLNPRYMVKNPVMFTVEIGTFIMAGVCVWIAMGETSQGSLAYNITVTAILFLTVLFANFAEAMAEGRGRLQARARALARTGARAQLSRLFVDRPGRQPRRRHADDPPRRRAAPG